MNSSFFSALKRPQKLKSNMKMGLWLHLPLRGINMYVLAEIPGI